MLCRLDEGNIYEGYLIGAISTISAVLVGGGLQPRQSLDNTTADRMFRR
jgi:hypothetical protein